MRLWGQERKDSDHSKISPWSTASLATTLPGLVAHCAFSHDNNWIKKQGCENVQTDKTVVHSASVLLRLWFAKFHELILLAFRLVFACPFAFSCCNKSGLSQFWTICLLTIVKTEIFSCTHNPLYLSKLWNLNSLQWHQKSQLVTLQHTVDPHCPPRTPQQTNSCISRLFVEITLTVHNNG